MGPGRQRRFPGERRMRALPMGVAVGIAVLIAFTAFVLKLAEDAVRSEAESRVRTSAQLGAQLVGEQSLRFEELLGVYALRLRDVPRPRHARMPRRDLRRVQDTLDAIVREVDGVAGATFTDALGRVLASSPSGRVKLRMDLSGREWYRGVTRTHRTYVSRAIRSVAAGNPKVTIVATPVRGPGGRALGILVVSEERRVQDMADALGRQLKAELVVTDQAGVVVARTGHASNRLLSRRDDPVVAAALRGRDGVDVRTIGDDETVSGYAPIPRSGWTVTANVLGDEAFEDIPRLRVALLAACGIVAFVLLWLVPLLVNRLGRARDALDISTAFQSDFLPAALPAGVTAHYVASEQRMLLGGDFLDAVQTPDGALAICIGDVCGHGPRAAALGATLRAGWRTLASAGSPVERIELLDRLVESERRDDDLFATVACAVVAPDAEHVRVVLAGHPPPILVHDGGQIATIEDQRGPALGLGAGEEGSWPVVERTLQGSWALALYTDGLIEARQDRSLPRLRLEGLLALVGHSIRDGRLDADVLLRSVAGLTTPRTLADDVALLVIDGATVRQGMLSRRFDAANLG
ncbi:MAG TPA: SpoIIE family protein phosphatase [Solirubrobacteraceae bacterium]